LPPLFELTQQRGQAPLPDLFYSSISIEVFIVLFVPFCG
jgi:hypothetical protein